MLDDKICGFNVNEFHLVTMIMPYIYEAVNEGKKITTFFEKDVKDVYEKLSNINEKYWRNKSTLDKLDWKKVENSMLSRKFEENADILIVAGKNEFINKINGIAINFHTNFTLVNCFEIGDDNDDLINVVKKYNKILTTKGIEDVKEMYLV